MFNHKLIIMAESLFRNLFNEKRTHTMPSASKHATAIEILQQLIRFDTTNPPGNEKACVSYIQQMLEDAGIETQIYAKDENRPNLVAKLPGKGDAPPLLMYGHVDVVTTADQKWTYPPFEGVIADGFIWGRGALDMKGGVAMMLAAMIKAKSEELTPAGDVIFMVLSDEEVGGEYGAAYMVEKHPDVFEGVKYALGEFGGSN
ncbi:MAG: M20/M25/M40 family metallo-hydrolase [Anaerolineales bacterium]